MADKTTTGPEITGWDGSDEMNLKVRSLALDAALRVSPNNSRVTNIIASAGEFEAYIRSGAAVPAQKPAGRR